MVSYAINIGEGNAAEHRVPPSQPTSSSPSKPPNMSHTIHRGVEAGTQTTDETESKIKALQQKLEATAISEIRKNEVAFKEQLAQMLHAHQASLTAMEERAIKSEKEHRAQLMQMLRAHEEAMEKIGSQTRASASFGKAAAAAAMLLAQDSALALL